MPRCNESSMSFPKLDWIFFLCIFTHEGKKKSNQAFACASNVATNRTLDYGYLCKWQFRRKALINLVTPLMREHPPPLRFGHDLVAVRITCTECFLRVSGVACKRAPIFVCWVCEKRLSAYFSLLKYVDIRESYFRSMRFFVTNKADFGGVSDVPIAHFIREKYWKWELTQMKWMV